jgi:hypothetical protein
MAADLSQKRALMGIFKSDQSKLQSAEFKKPNDQYRETQSAADGRRWTL